MAITQPNQSTYGDTFNPVVKNAAQMKATVFLELNLASYTQKIFPPGLFASHNGTIYRLLPRTRFKSNAGAVVTVSTFTAGLFFPGDVLTLIDGSGNAGLAFGTVQSIQHAANTITLAAAPANVPAVDGLIGIATFKPTLADGTKLGLVSPNTALNLDDTGRFPTVMNNHFSAFQSGSFWRARMPHLDPNLEATFPEMTFS